MAINPQDLVRDYAPHAVHSLALGLFNSWQYRMRRGGDYGRHREYHRQLMTAPASWIEDESARLFEDFVEHARSNSAYYRESLCSAPSQIRLSDIKDLPVLSKTDLVDQVQRISTVSDKDKPVVSYTGGTTGASLRVLYTKSDVQERAAILDLFREQFGFKPGARVAWFSGKDFLSKRDRASHRYMKIDRFEKVGFVSTFDIAQGSAEHIASQIADFNPEFIVGFPTSVAGLLRFLGPEHPTLKRLNVRACFPTAETVTTELRETIESALGTRVVDQYASSEGAPFITECVEGRLHLNPLSGIFEVVDSEGNEASEGELLVTSFTTHGTPLIRYAVGDRISLADPAFRCNCGQQTQVASEILGRTDDYAIAVDGRHVNLGNLSNSTKGVNGLLRMQLLQHGPGDATVLVVANQAFDQSAEAKFDSALRVRLGEHAKLTISRVDQIDHAKSGKYRLVIHEGR